MAKSKLLKKKARKSSKMPKTDIVRFQAVPPPPPKVGIPGATALGKDFYKCVMGLEPGMPARIPDGADCKSLALSMKLAVSILPDSNGNIYGWVRPGLPASLFIAAGTFSCLPVAGGSSTTYTLTSGGSVIPIGVPFVEETALTPGQSGATMFMNGRGITKARFVGGKLELQPTGPPLTRQGQIVVTDVSANYESALLPAFVQDNNTGTIAGTSTNWIDLCGLSKSVLIGNGTVASFLNFNSLSTQPGAQVCEYGEVACHAVLKPGTDYGCFKNACAIVTGTAPVSLSLDNFAEFSSYLLMTPPGALGPCGIGGGGAGDINYDVANAFPGVAYEGENRRYLAGSYWIEEGAPFKAFSATGLASTQPLMVTLDLCVEACVQFNSAYRGFVSPVPRADVKALKAAASVLAELPASVSSEQGKPWYSTFAEVMSSVGGAVSELGIPWLSPIAGAIGKLSRMAL
jgi:hypothetical protein